MTQTFFRHIWLPLLFALAACQAAPPAGVKIGKPYEVDGVLYRPAYQPEYVEEGEASWYGPGFHGKYTASGEVYDQSDMTAAHPTLPMPSIVRVTNLQNGKSQIVRINDRGPFKSKRIIDLSKAAANSLGIKGVAKVRVEYLKKESEEYIASQPGGQESLRRLAMLTPRSSSSQMVDSTVSNTTAGQTVDAAAPIMTVSSNDLSSPTKTTVDGKEVFSPPHGNSHLIREAYADENMNPRAGDGSDTAAKNNAPEQPPPRLASTTDPPKDRGGGYYVQAGVFSHEENARKLVSYLTDLDGIDVSENHGLWNVKIGPYDEVSQAETTLRRVHAVGVNDARVVYQ